MSMRELPNANAVRRASSILFVAAIPLLLITAAVTWAINDLSLYKYGFDKYDVPLVTGIERDDLVSIGVQLRGYFNSTTEPLDVRAPVFGEETYVFNQREIIHMHDVKRLVWGVYGIGAASALHILGFLTFGLLKRREQLYGSLARYAFWGSGLTVGIVVLVGLGSLLGFDSLFRGFHEVAFTNDFWQFDSRRDRLVMMFPEDFWFDATMLVALLAVGQAVVLAGVTGGVVVFRRQGRNRGKTTEAYRVGSS